MDAPALADVLEQFSDHAVNPFQQEHPFYVLIEVASKSLGEDEESPNLDRLFNLIEHAGESITDGVVAQDQKQFDQIWLLREQAAPANFNRGYCFIYDLSLKPTDYYRIVEETRKLLQTAPGLSDAERSSIYTAAYGHLADGNLHLTVVCPGFEDEDL